MSSSWARDSTAPGAARREGEAAGQPAAAHPYTDRPLLQDARELRFAIVSDRTSAGGTPLIVHNIGAGAREEDVLRAFTITGQYRYQPEALIEACGEPEPR